MDNTNLYLDFYGLHRYDEKLKKYVDDKTKIDNRSITRNSSGELQIIQELKEKIENIKLSYGGLITPEIDISTLNSSNWYFTDPHHPGTYEWINVFAGRNRQESITTLPNSAYFFYPIEKSYFSMDGSEGTHLNWEYICLNLGTDNPDDDLPGKVITLKLFDETILDLKDYVSENYASNTKVSQIISRLNTLVGADEEGHKIDVTSVIDTFNEIKDFLANIEDTTLTELFNLVNTRISSTLLLVGIDNIQEFDSTKNYSINDLVIYSNKLYKFIETHSAGAWIGTDTLETDLIKEINHRLTETINNALAVVNLSATPSMVFVGDSLSINLVATTDSEATEISIRDNDTVIAEGSGTRLTCYKSIETAQLGITDFYASFIIKGITKTVSATVSAVHKIHYGSGTVYTDAAIVPPVRLTPEGSYNVVVTEDGQYVFFNIPTYMMLNGATMNGIEFPLDEPTTITIDDTEYKSYRSSNTIDAGTYEIIIY